MNSPMTATPNWWRRQNRIRKGLMLGGATVVLLGAGAAAGGRQDPTDSAPNPVASTSTAPIDTPETPAPMVTQAPATTESPAATEAPVVTEPAPVTEAPVVTEAPATTIAPTTIAPVTTPPITYAVAGVVDGDTVDIAASDGQAFRVRVIGIDAPEMDTCEGGPATDAMLALVQNKQVALTMGGDGEDTDRYGRYLRYIDVDGVDAGLSLIQQGHAIARYDSRDGYGLHTREADYIAADAASPDYTCPPPPPPPPPLPPTDAPRRDRTPDTAPANPHYANCDAVRAAGAAPIHPGDPGWQQKFDRDKDGVGCE
jgi:micrococcal nuclease